MKTLIKYILISCAAIPQVHSAPVRLLEDAEMGTLWGRMECAECTPVSSNCDGTDSGGGCTEAGEYPLIGCINDGCASRDVAPNVVDGRCGGFNQSFNCEMDPGWPGAYWRMCKTKCGPAIALICACTKNRNGSTSYTDVSSKNCKQSNR